MKTNIAISRLLGSGGSYIGRLIASRLDFRYVDREVLHLAAQELGVEPEELSARAEKLSSFWQKTFQGFSFGIPDSRYIPPPIRLLTDQELFDKQTDIMKMIAVQSDCVIVGWGAAHVLPRHDQTLTVFCHAPLASRIKRVIDIYDAPDEESARTMIEESDEMRKKYIMQMTGKDWTCSENYDLAFNTDLLSLKEIAEIIIKVIKNKTASK